MIRSPNSSLQHLEFAKSLAGSPVQAGGVSHALAGSSLWHWSSRVFTGYMTRGWALPTRRSFAVRTFLLSRRSGTSDHQKSRTVSIVFSWLVCNKGPRFPLWPSSPGPFPYCGWGRGALFIHQSGPLLSTRTGRGGREVRAVSGYNCLFS